MKIVITGSSGQLGRCLLEVFKEDDVHPIDLPDWDLTSPDFGSRLAELSPKLVIHAAAYTNVDGCTRDPEKAFRVNAFGTAQVADACRVCKAAMVYLSTNEVFSGEATTPYSEYAATNPLNVYAFSKLAGEQMALRRLRRLYIARIAWLYGPGSINFPSKIIALASQQNKLKVVTDEVANPTYAPDLAEAIRKLIPTGCYGTYHLVNEGEASRHEFARAILEKTGFGKTPVEPILRKDFDRSSTPPAYTALRNDMAAALGIRLRPWQDALDAYTKEILS